MTDSSPAWQDNPVSVRGSKVNINQWLGICVGTLGQTVLSYNLGSYLHIPVTHWGVAPALI